MLISLWGAIVVELMQTDSVQLHDLSSIIPGGKSIIVSI